MPSETKFHSPESECVLASLGWDWIKTHAKAQCTKCHSPKWKCMHWQQGKRRLPKRHIYRQGASIKRKSNRKEKSKMNNGHQLSSSGRDIECVYRLAFAQKNINWKLLIFVFGYETHRKKIWLIVKRTDKWSTCLHDWRLNSNIEKHHNEMNTIANYKSPKRRIRTLIIILITAHSFNEITSISYKRFYWIKLNGTKRPKYWPVKFDVRIWKWNEREKPLTSYMDGERKIQFGVKFETQISSCSVSFFMGSIIAMCLILGKNQLKFKWIHWVNWRVRRKSRASIGDGFFFGLVLISINEVTMFISQPRCKWAATIFQLEWIDCRQNPSPCNIVHVNNIDARFYPLALKSI